MKVATFNINNINKRLGNLLAWLERAEPDVVSLQERKQPIAQIGPEVPERAAGVDELRTQEGHEQPQEGSRPDSEDAADVERDSELTERARDGLAQQ